jgi:S-adenosylmethionine:tRNA ribosyltransferase-isomerase
MQLSDFDFELPQELIAQHPIEPRDHSRLLVCDLTANSVGDEPSLVVSHQYFYDLPNLLNHNDVLIFNDSKVLPVRVLGTRADTKGRVEMLLLRPVPKEEGGEAHAYAPGFTADWYVLLKLTSKIFKGMVLKFGPVDCSLEVVVQSSDDDRRNRDGETRVSIRCLTSHSPHYQSAMESLEVWLQYYGEVPLPHYIAASNSDLVKTPEMKQQYQTVYAKTPGSAAAPTAGFHFTSGLLQKLCEKNIDTGFVTLHVGVGTFRPVKTESILDHKMHTEYYEITETLIQLLRRAEHDGRRVVAVGTTTVRALESHKNKFPNLEDWTPGIYATNIFIYPSYEFQIVDDLITNFHLPKSSLLMLVAARMGYKNTISVYKTAVEQRYRFFSFGDAMFIRFR